ncbi:HlyC/CorC family transporter [Mycetocola reblochoni]|uniref:Magnesium and cobalt efflux protein CorC n=2 Tax=Mycetocola reblochoni TaxID=331618 RepID=A0A1R4K4J1_9MICO|nr:hemolysin family protein [Mycetocola reblochoni]RLP69891.1 HlyC/CorC family transporter [Mycetocola reblochoni]SJN38995.1 Magnesium and cobalt efflux protein CorC [Mycetocola reblochoni REB411]
MPVVPFLVLAIVLIAFAAMMAAADAAIGVYSRAGILEVADSRSRGGGALKAIAADPVAHVNAINFIRIASETTAAVLVTLVFAAAWESPWLVLVVSALVMSAASFVLVGASPRGFGRNNATVMLVVTAPVVRAVRVLLGPIANALVAASNRVTPGVPRSASFSSEEQLLSMVDEATELSVLEEDDRELIHSIFEFNETVAREVMVPRTDMVTLQSDDTVRTAMALFLSSGVSRLPVVGEDVDDVVGVLYLRDLAKHIFEREHGAEDQGVVPLLREPFFVPESQQVDTLMAQMQQESVHLALVVDEYGGIAGLVTLEDIIEELVGEISDEYDGEQSDAVDLGDGRWRVSARLAVDELGELFGRSIEDEDVDSVGGLLAKTLGRLPERGSRVVVSGIALTAERTEGRSKNLVTVIAEAAADPTPPAGENTEEPTS